LISLLALESIPQFGLGATKKFDELIIEVANPNAAVEMIEAASPGK
jgi:hypothetical protein